MSILHILFFSVVVFTCFARFAPTTSARANCCLLFFGSVGGSAATVHWYIPNQSVTGYPVGPKPGNLYGTNAKETETIINVRRRDVNGFGIPESRVWFQSFRTAAAQSETVTRSGNRSGKITRRWFNEQLVTGRRS